MAFWATAHFLAKYGWGSFVTLYEMINDGKQLKEIATVIGLSEAQICRYRKTLFDTKYVPKTGTEHALKEFADKDRLNYDHKRKFVDSSKGNIYELKEAAE